MSACCVCGELQSLPPIRWQGEAWCRRCWGRDACFVCGQQLARRRPHNVPPTCEAHNDASARRSAGEYARAVSDATGWTITRRRVGCWATVGIVRGYMDQRRRWVITSPLAVGIRHVEMSKEMGGAPWPTAIDVPRDAVSVAEAARRLGITERAVHARGAAGKLDIVRVGWRVWVSGAPSMPA